MDSDRLDKPALDAHRLGNQRPNGTCSRYCISMGLDCLVWGPVTNCAVPFRDLEMDHTVLVGRGDQENIEKLQLILNLDRTTVVV